MAFPFLMFNIAHLWAGSKMFLLSYREVDKRLCAIYEQTDKLFSNILQKISFIRNCIMVQYKGR